MDVSEDQFPVFVPVFTLRVQQTLLSQGIHGSFSAFRWAPIVRALGKDGIEVDGINRVNDHGESLTVVECMCVTVFPILLGEYVVKEVSVWVEKEVELVTDRA